MSSADRLKALLDAAFKSSPAREANAAISKTRDEFGELSGTEAWSYEVLLPANDPVRFLLEDTLPRLTYFLHSHGKPQGAGVFLSIFHEDTLYFLAVPDALALLSEWSGLSLDDMKARWQDGYGQPPLMLPGR